MGRIDTDLLRARTDLLALTGRDTQLKRMAASGRGEWAGPCPFCGGRDRFRVQPHAEGGGRWLCRACTEGKWQDVIAYVMRREAADFRRACELLGAADTLPARPRPAAVAEPKRTEGPPPAEWQSRARALIAECERNLWGAERAQRARDWLAARGLTDDTLRRCRVGYNPGVGTGRDIAGLLVPFGVVIPCEVGGAMWYVKVRRASGESKYLHVKGGRPALFGADTLTGHDVAVLCEGEFDAMLLKQEAGDLAGVATLGSANASLDLAAWGAYLLPLARLLIAYDGDSAGRNGSGRLAELTTRARRVSVPAMPGVKDLTDFHKAGGRLRDWLAFEIARLDLPTLAHGAQPVAESDWIADALGDCGYALTVTGQSSDRVTMTAETTRAATEAAWGREFHAWADDLDRTHDGDYALQFAALSIRMGLACYADDDPERDLGAAGWRGG